MSESPQLEQFVQLLTDHQRQLYVYILAMLPKPTDADEVLQNTNLVLWRKAGEFQPGSNFGAWATRIAQFEAMAFRKARQRTEMRFEPVVMETLAAESAARFDLVNDRRRALIECLQKLQPRERDLISRRYQLDQSASEVAQGIGRSLQATYQALHRVRVSLMDCIQRTLAAEDRP